ncbi:MAG: hypothetical protein JSR61_22300, partial [Proteobacteria bacterium]|nr:hypothetical protein [Pseudomonadota bacterium]
MLQQQMLCLFRRRFVTTGGLRRAAFTGTGIEVLTLAAIAAAMTAAAAAEAIGTFALFMSVAASLAAMLGTVDRAATGDEGGQAAGDVRLRLLMLWLLLYARRKLRVARQIRL